MAFLATIPCPAFNTKFNVEFFNKSLTIEEPSYNIVPDKNQIAIRVLFDLLDVRTILYCWKALLLDYKLVLISGQYSLQFYVATALLQLMFPLAWPWLFLQPTNHKRIDLVEAP